ncbi:MAG: prolyl oligopeptidase family serine peptidase, partial [Myxococcales bacterium]|nr:prolyl oligopeptidase family serine peptidase [Myxococcales bacterium]
AFLITTRKKDTRVSPMNSYKFAAVLADHQRAEAPVLLRVDEIGGHSSSTLPLDQRIDYLADVYAFAWSMTGGKTRPPAE